MNKKEVINACQLIINTSDGKLGEVVDIFPKSSFRFSVGDVSGIYAYDRKDSNKLYIIFEATNSIKDWSDDFSTKLVDYPYKAEFGKVHEGFLKQYNQIRDFIHTKLSSSKRIVIAGHSLGGALATLCAIDLASNYSFRELKCITIGSPKVGDKNFKQSYNLFNIETLRLVYNNDIACKQPPFFMWKYKHIIPKFWLKNKWNFNPILSIFGNPIDHFPMNYINAINNMDFDKEYERFLEKWRG